MNKNQKGRIGSHNDWAEISSHPWFKDIDWKKLNSKELEPTFKPKISGDAWMTNFDEEFINEDAINSYVPGNNVKLIEEYAEEFKEFDVKK